MICFPECSFRQSDRPQKLAEPRRQLRPNCYWHRGYTRLVAGRRICSANIASQAMYQLDSRLYSVQTDVLHNLDAKWTNLMSKGTFQNLITPFRQMVHFRTQSSSKWRVLVGSVYSATISDPKLTMPGVTSSAYLLMPAATQALPVPHKFKSDECQKQA